MAGKSKGRYAENKKAIDAGLVSCSIHPLIAPLPGFDVKLDGPALELTAGEWLRAECSMSYDWQTRGPAPALTVWPNVRRRAPPEQWAYVFARLCLHIALDHIDPAGSDPSWHFAAWYLSDELAALSGIGKRPGEFMPLPPGLPRGEVETLAEHFRQNGAPPDVESLSLGLPGRAFWSFDGHVTTPQVVRDKRRASLARGIRAAAAAAVDVAGGARESLTSHKPKVTNIQLARKWVISEFPLLSALAASFTLVEDEDVCASMDVQVAAISDEAQEIYFNPRAKLSDEEARFVVAHELLHSGLRHIPRRQGRDPWLWNVACDYVVNDWLIEMQVGTAPEDIGYLHDPILKDLSAEEVYDRIVSDLRLRRRLEKARTMNGNSPDMLDGTHGPSWWRGGGVDLDTFYRRALAEGLELHLGRGRGFLPAGLVEEIRSLLQPPIPWDVELSHWLDQYFPPLERKRSYARAHRRQSATPDIPRPAWIAPDEMKSSRVLAAVIDTSGSMGRSDLGKALGAIASYAMSRDVGFVRLVQCDAAAHDSGYVEPEVLLDRVQIKGRGGTVLMPGIRLVERADDYPKDGPILIVTDGACDRLATSRDHAILLAAGGRLAFPTRAPVFQVA
ncbi:MAG: peptidase [Alphaproteobacteria bacterium]|nr:peptidase [Alphaproteobacteria bacterium]